MSEPPPSEPTPALTADDRLDSWKEIASYLRRDVTTVQRWEKREAMPVHRHLHDKMGSVYAFRAELDAWVERRRPGQAGESEGGGPEPDPTASEAPAADADRAPERLAEPAATDGPSVRRRRPAALWIVLATAVVVVASTLWLLDRRDAYWRSPLARAQLLKVTDFEGTEQAAAISRDGSFVAFLSDRDGHFDVWVTRLGTGQFYNLTRDSPRELVNPSVRTLGFTPDGASVTFWSRKPGGTGAEIGIWAAPLLGGPPRSYLDGAAEHDWSPDGSRLVYHTPAAGDPMFIRETGQTSQDRHLFTAPAGQHSHFPLWSPDQAFVYFVQGSVPDRMDIWRIPASGGTPERITHHAAHVSHPAFLDARTLVYLAGDASGGGPWLFSIDVERRRPRRLSSGIDRYTSLAAGADGKRLVVTQATTRPTLWRLPIGDGVAGMREARRISLTTGSGFFPRLGPDYLLYVVRNTAGDTVWKRQGEVATEVWTAPEARLLGAPAIAPDGRRVALSFRQGGRTVLGLMNADGAGFRVLAGTLELQGSSAWTPDGRSITSAAVELGVPRLVGVSVDGGGATPLLAGYSLDPAWSPDGTFVVFSGPDIGTTFLVKAAGVDGRGRPLPTLTLSRGARRLRFLPGRRALLFMRGELRHKNLWLLDLETGHPRQLTDLPPDFELRDFDVTTDGREAVLEQAQEQSDVVQLDVPR